MFRSIHLCCIAIFLLQLITSLGSPMGQDFQELKRPYFCSTCFTTTQDQNYHCCFYFFKCCAEARLGSRSTTPNPNYPGLPSGMTFFVQNRNARPCSVDCRDPKQAPNLCCRMQISKSSSAFIPAERVFKPAFNVQAMDEEDTDTLSQSYHPDSDKKSETSETQTPAAAENTSRDKYHNLGLEINGSPFRQNLKNINSEKKIFHSPSLIFDHETESDATKGEENWRKQGWYTKDILNQEIKREES